MRLYDLMNQVKVQNIPYDAKVVFELVEMSANITGSYYQESTNTIFLSAELIDQYVDDLKEE